MRQVVCRPLDSPLTHKRHDLPLLSLFCTPVGFRCTCPKGSRSRTCVAPTAQTKSGVGASALNQRADLKEICGNCGAKFLKLFCCKGDSDETLPSKAHKKQIVDNGGRCDLRVSFVLSVVRFFSRTFDSVIDKNTLSRVA